MPSAVAKLLSAEPTIALVGEATSFAETLRQCVATNPDVLLIDLHMPDEQEYPPEHLDPVISYHARNIIALSLWDDDKARALARSSGAHLLLDKTLR
jgi:DNA-binding NarL/FixJ family response regulator